MFGLSFFQRSKVTKPVPRPTFRPRVDELETRLCPDGSLLTLGAQVSPGHLVQLTGTLTGGQVAGVTVVFSGAASGSTQTDQNGAYSFTTNSASLGSVTAQIYPTTSAAVSTNAVIDEPAPVLALSASYGPQNSVTLTGKLADIDYAGQIVTLTGAVSGTVVTDGNGGFCLISKVNSPGEIDAATTDLWSKSSSVAAVLAPSSAPVITNFSAVHQAGTLWYFSGTVSTPNPTGMVITFGGLDGALDGQTATVRSDGTFSVSIFLPTGAGGTVTAITTDWWGQESNEAWVTVN